MLTFQCTVSIVNWWWKDEGDEKNKTPIDLNSNFIFHLKCDNTNIILYGDKLPKKNIISIHLDLCCSMLS